MPGGRVYVVNSPTLAVSLQRLPMKISFWHVEALFTGRLAGLSTFAAKTLAHNVNGHDGQPSYLREGMANAHAAMRPGDNLASATRASLQLLEHLLETFDEKRSGQFELYSWLTKTIMAAVTGSIFGPKNPYEDPGIIDAF